MPSGPARLLPRLFPRGGFLRAAAGMASASVLAQAIGVASAPVLARLFTPAEIGVLALFSAVAGLLGLLAGGRWHLAFATATEDRSALLSLTALVAGLAVLVLGLPALGAGQWLAARVGTSHPVWAWLAPAGAAVMAMNLALRWLAVAEGESGRAARALVWRAAVAAACQTAAGVAGAGAGGLVAGALAGWLVATLTLLPGRRFERDPARIRAAGLRWRRYPLQALPGAIAAQTVIVLPELYIALRHGTGELGLYAMVVRLLAAPVVVLGEAISALWWRRAASVAPGATLLRLFDRLLLGLGAIALAGAAVVMLFGPSLFALALGGGWRRAGELARLAAPYHAMRLVSAPMLQTGAALGQLRPVAVWSGIDLALALAACAAGIGFDLSLEAWLALHAGLGALSRLVVLLVVRRQAAGLSRR